MGNSKEKNKIPFLKTVLPVLVVLFLIVVVGAAWVVSILIERKTPTDKRMDVLAYYEMTEDDQAALVVNGSVLDSYGKMIDGTIYIDYETVSAYINKRFYWDRNEGLLLYALPTEVVEVNLTQGHTDYPIVEEQLYISINVIQQYSDMDCQILTDPNRVVIRNKWDGLYVVQATEDTPVRYRGGIKSEILTDVQKGTKIQVLDAESFDNWTQVATSDGYVGYIDNQYIGDVEELVNDHVYQGPEYTSLTRDHKINMVWHQVTSQMANAAAPDLLERVSGVNVVAPTWFFINDINGDMVNLASSDYVTYAHEHGMEVWAVLNDFDGNMASADSTYAVLSKTNARKKIITEVVTSVLECGADGINVDIENVSETCAPHYLQFLRELSVQCRNNGLVLSVDNYVPTYSIYLDRTEQGIVADYIVIMGYDEHFAGSETAGSVASIGFVEDGIKRTLEEVPAEKLINGIPFYTRVWITDNNGNLSSEAYGMAAAAEFVTNNSIEIYWDGDCGQYYGEVQTDETFYQIWMEDGRSVEEKMRLIKQYQLAGAAAWKLGFETEDIWSIINKYLQ